MKPHDPRWKQAGLSEAELNLMSFKTTARMAQKSVVSDLERSVHTLKNLLAAEEAALADAKSVYELIINLK